MVMRLRAYVVPAGDRGEDGTAGKGKPSGRTPRLPNRRVEPSHYTLVFDTETDPGPAQQLRIGGCQVRKGHDLLGVELFYDPLSVRPNEMIAIERYIADPRVRADEHRGLALAIRPVDKWRHHMLYEYSYRLNGTLLAFNVGFDVSRVAITHSPARGDMKSGFSYALSEQPDDEPNIRIRNIDSRKALKGFAAPRATETSPRQRKRGVAPEAPHGHLIDVRTLAGAVLGRSFSLATLATELDIDHPKRHLDSYDRPIDATFLDYLLSDIQATWECFVKLEARYKAMGLTKTPIDRILSEASVGKAHLTEMGIQGWRTLQPDFDPATIGRVVSTFYGAKAATRYRRKIGRIKHFDFTSQYPTVCVLMHLWKFVIAQHMTTHDSTETVRAFLQTVTLEDLQKKETWEPDAACPLTTIVQVLPDGDVLPFRGDYGRLSDSEEEDEGTGEFPDDADDGSGAANIGINYVRDSRPVWYSLLDCIQSKLATGGKVTNALRAITFKPGPPQKDLKTIHLLGRRDLEIDPNRDDFFQALIELRAKVRSDQKTAHAALRVTEAALRKAKKGRRSVEAARLGAELPKLKASVDRLDHDQLAIKLVANATSYGIFSEIIVKEADKLQRVRVYMGDDEPYETDTKNVEEPGAFYHPLLATLITGAGRLLLGIVDRLCSDRGLDWEFCDTDGTAILQTDRVSEEEFDHLADEVGAWFQPLNPYRGDAGKTAVFKSEDVNLRVDENGDPVVDKDGRPTGELEPLYALSVSAKRYSEFNLTPERTPKIRSASSHGLGLYLAPYGDDHQTKGVPPPVGRHYNPDRLQWENKVSKVGVPRWHHDYWYQVIMAHLEGHPDEIILDDPAWGAPAVQRYTATSPAVLKWMAPYNRGKPYRERIRPNGFLARVTPVRSFDEEVGAVQPDPHEERQERTDAWEALRAPIAERGGICPTPDYPPDMIPRSVRRYAGLPPDQMAAALDEPSTAKFMRKVFDTYNALSVLKAKRRRGRNLPAVVAPFSTDPWEVARNAFDPETGEKWTGRLKSYRRALASYHVHPESKSLHGGVNDSGFTELRHIEATGRVGIGKESHRWVQRHENSNELGRDTFLGHDRASRERRLDLARDLVMSYPRRVVAKASSMSPRLVTAVHQGKAVDQKTVAKIAAAAPAIHAMANQIAEARNRRHEAVRAAVRERAAVLGWRGLAKTLDMESSTLYKLANRSADIRPRTLARLEAAIVALDTLGPAVRMAKTLSGRPSEPMPSASPQEPPTL
jgi:hypothetical protein